MKEGRTAAASAGEAGGLSLTRIDVHQAQLSIYHLGMERRKKRQRFVVAWRHRFISRRAVTPVSRIGMWRTVLRQASLWSEAEVDAH